MHLPQKLLSVRLTCVVIALIGLLIFENKWGIDCQVRQLPPPPPPFLPATSTQGLGHGSAVNIVFDMNNLFGILEELVLEIE